MLGQTRGTRDHFLFLYLGSEPLAVAAKKALRVTPLSLEALGTGPPHRKDDLPTSRRYGSYLEFNNLLD